MEPPDALPTLEALEAQVLVAQRALADHEVPCFAYLALHNRGRERLYLLGWRTLAGAEATVLHWQTSPLASLFFSHREGDDYELAVDGRTLEGRVLLRGLLFFERGALTGIEYAGALWTRASGAAWTRAEPLPVAARTTPEHDRLRARSPVEVPLDAAQRAAIERPAGGALLVLGEAGCGKTTVALHRLARLWQQRDRAGERLRAAVLVPTEGLRRLCASLLERLGLEGVEVAVLEHWAGTLARRAFPAIARRESEHAPPAALRLKRHRALALALDERAAQPAPDAEGAPLRARLSRHDLLHLFGDRALLERVVRASEGALSPRDVEPVALHTRRQFDDSTDSLLRSVTDGDRVQALDGRSLDAGTSEADAGTVDAEDYPVLFALDRRRALLRREPEPPLPVRYDALVLDEAQELAPLELELVRRALVRGGTLVIAGDEGQQVDPTACFEGWDTTLRDLGAPGAPTLTLRTSYRSPAVVTWLARLVLGRGALAHDPRDAQGPLAALRAHNDCHLLARLLEHVRALREGDPRCTVAVLTHDEASARRFHALVRRGLDARLALEGDFRFEPGVTVTCVQEVKGLEFDHLVLPEVGPSAYPDTGEGRRALYVALTRAVASVLVCPVGSWSPLLPPQLTALAQT